MLNLSTDLVLVGMIVLGVVLCLFGFFVEVRRRRQEQRREVHRQHLFIHSHAQALRAAEAAQPDTPARGIPVPASTP